MCLPSALHSSSRVIFKRLNVAERQNAKRRHLMLILAAFFLCYHIPDRTRSTLSVSKVLLLVIVFKPLSENGKRTKKHSTKTIDRANMYRFISWSFLVSPFVPKLWAFEKMRGSNTFATDITRPFPEISSLMWSQIILVSPCKQQELTG